MRKLNDIDMDRWKEYDHIFTDSLWLIDKRDNTGAHHAGYHGLFVPDIPRQAMLRYTRQGETVLDCFAGSGTTLIEARRLGRNSIGIELNQSVAQQAINTAYQEPNPHDMKTLMYVGDSTTNAPYIAMKNQIDLVILHPPYHNIITFSSDKNDLSNCYDVNEFVNKMERVFYHAYEVLRRGKYMVLVIGDYYANKEHVPLSYMLMERALKKGFKLKSHVVKNIENNRGKANQINLWRYRALTGGFYIFKHENIFFFFKP